MIDAPDLLRFLQEEEMRALDTTLNAERAAAVSFYNGDPYGDEEEGRSQLVTRDVAEVVDQMTISVLRTMVASDKVVEFEDSDHDIDGDGIDDAVQGAAGNPIGYAQQATEAVHYFFMKRGDGYSVLHDSLKAGLMEKTGWVKVYPEQPEPKRRVMAVPAELLGTVNAVEAEPVDPANEGGLWHVAVHEPQPVRFVAITVPNEEMRVAPDARNLDPQYLPYIGQVTAKSVSDLAQMGFDVTGLSDEDNGLKEDVLSNARDADRAWNWQMVDRDGPMRRVLLVEEYPLYDLNGDGIAERLCVHRVGNTILSIQEVDDHPFEYWCPFPMQHRLVGQSLGDKVSDIQRTNTVLLRNAMDSLYIGLAPRTFINENSIGTSTIDDLLTVRPNAIVRWKGSERPETLRNDDTSATAFQAIEFMIGQREGRTGITRHNQGLNADTLNHTATGFALQQAAGQQVQEYVARNFAEMLVSRLFAKFYRLMRQFGSPFTMRIDGQRVMIDPRQWPEEIDINIRVGLGTGNKDQRLQYRMQLLTVQQQALMAGAPIVTWENAFNNIRGMIEDASLGNPMDYVTDPAMAQQQPQQPQPDPKLAEVQGKMQLAQQKLQGDQALAAAKHGLEVQKAQANTHLQAASDQAQLHLANQKMQAEIIMNEQRMAAEMDLAERKGEHDISIAQAKLSQNRHGGNLDQ